MELFKGNTSPSLTDTIRVDGAPFDLTDCTVKFQMKLIGASSLTVDTAATIVDAEAGEVRYDWQAADVDTAGSFIG